MGIFEFQKCKMYYMYVWNNYLFSYCQMFVKCMLVRNSISSYFDASCIVRYKALAILFEMSVMIENDSSHLNDIVITT